MANPEGGGLLGFLKKLLRLEAQPKAPQKIVPPQASPIPEKSDKKAKAALVLQELKNVTPQHQARAILQGINFSEQTLADHPEVADLLLNIIHTTDPTLYHNQEWLTKIYNKIEDLGGQLTAGSQDHTTLGVVGQKIDSLRTKVDLHRRNIEIEKERKKSSWLPEEEKERELAREEAATGIPRRTITTPAEKSWDKAIGELPDDPDPKSEIGKNITKVKEATAALSTENFGSKREIEWWKDVTDGFEAAKKEAIRNMHKLSEGSKKQEAATKYESLNKAYEKAARHFVETHPSERGRLYDAVFRQAGGEFIEKKIHDDPNYRDYWFYHILEPILFNKRAESHRELYNLYVAGDMDTFLDIVRRIKGPEGERIGLRLAARYDILKNTIFQSHDMDYYAAHPSQDMKEFIGSTSIFTNTLIDAATQDPMVALAKRMYEVALFQIRDTNNGYIPREWLQWEEGKLRGSKLDEMVEKLLEEAIAAGQLYHTQIDPISGLPAPSVWNRKQIDPTRPITLNELYGYEPAQSEEYGRNLGDLKKASALKQAKGLALVDMRLLEIIGRSRGTGGKVQYHDNPKFNLAASQFNSVPYEGIVRHVEPIIHYFSRYRVGFEYYDGFFNMMINDNPKAKWDPRLMYKVVELHEKGDQEGLKKYVQENNLGDLDTRLNQQDNPFQFSSMWGPNTGWRVGDASIDFDDWEKDQAYASAVKIVATADNWAVEKAKKYYIEVLHGDVYRSYRTKYRARLINSDNIRLREMAIRDRSLEASGRFDEDFEYNWRRIGILEKKAKEDASYADLLNKLWSVNIESHGNSAGKIKGSAFELKEKLRKAYIARNWVKAAMRAPLIVARELEVDWDKAGMGQRNALRRRIIWEILGIDVDEIAAMRTPLTSEEAAFDRIAELEGVIAAVSQAAIRKNKDLTPADFDHIQDETLRTNAKLYWEKVKNAMMGNKSAEEIYNLLGIKDVGKDEHIRGLRFHNVQWDTINKNIDVAVSKSLDKDKTKTTKLPFTSELLKTDLIDRNWRYLFSTEDMGWEYLNIGALGERNPVRRAGDLASHVQFGQEFEKYITENIVARPKVEDLVKQMKVMWEAMAGDFADIASDATGRIAYITGQMYRKSDWAWRYPFLSPIRSIFQDHSVMQMIRGRDRADAWGPNDMLHYVQAVGGAQIVPKRQYSGLGGTEIAPKSQWTAQKLGQVLGGTKTNATWEIINLTLMLATLITLWRAFTAKSEED